MSRRRPPRHALVVQCGGVSHRVGVSRKGRLFMADHDPKLERLAEALQPEAATVCREVFAVAVAEAKAREARALEGVPLSNDLAAYLALRRLTGKRRDARKVHVAQLVNISVMAGNPEGVAGLTLSAGNPKAEANRAKRHLRERILPQLFLRCAYPLLERYPPVGEGTPRGVCWHVQLTEPGVREDIRVVHSSYPLAATPRSRRVPNGGRTRPCASVTLPVASDWYAAVYVPGMAIVDGKLCLATRWNPLRVRDGYLVQQVVLLEQRGGHFVAADRAVEWDPDERRWHVVPDPQAATQLATRTAAERTDIAAIPGAPDRPGGTGDRPDPW